MVVSKLITSKRPTNRELAEHINQMHGCLDLVDQKLDGRIEQADKDRLERRDHEQMTDTRMGRVESALGIKLPSEAQMSAGEAPSPAKRKLAGLEPWKMYLGLFGAAASAAGFYRYLFPAVEAFVMALHHALMGG